MFGRRKPLNWRKRIQSWVWPHIGWGKYGKYLLLRLKRFGGSPRSIAAGVACGVAISFTPFVGFHFILAGSTAWLIRGNILASALGTAAGNPWTFPIIWVCVLYTGRWFLGSEQSMDISFTHVFESSMHSLITFDFSKFATDVWPIIFPMIIGCIPYYIVFWLITYFLVKRALEKINSVRKKENSL